MMCLVLVTAIGLLAAITLAISMERSYHQQQSSKLQVARTDDLLAAALDHLTDKANLLRLLGAKDTPSERKLTGNRAVANNLGEALQRANVSSKADLDLLDTISMPSLIRRNALAARITHHNRKLDILAHDANVACTAQVDGQAVRDAVHSSNDWLGSPLERRDGVLEGLWKLAPVYAAPGISRPGARVGPLTVIWWFKSRAARAGSTGFATFALPVSCVAVTMHEWGCRWWYSLSRPAVQTLSRAEARTMTRTWSQREMASTLACSSCQKLGISGEFVSSMFMTHASWKAFTGALEVLAVMYYGALTAPLSTSPYAPVELEKQNVGGGLRSAEELARELFSNVDHCSSMR